MTLLKSGKLSFDDSFSAEKQIIKPWYNAVSGQ